MFHKNFNYEKYLLLFICIILFALNVYRNTSLEPLGKSGISYRTLQIGILGSIISIFLFKNSKFLFNFFFIFIFFLCYENLKHIHSAYLSSILYSESFDLDLLEFERSIFGKRIILFYSTAIPENYLINKLFQATYALYYVIPIFTLFLLYLKRNEKALAYLKTNLYFQFFGGLVLYIIFPVSGPNSVFKIEYTGLNLVPITYHYQFDCFPSLHTSVTFSILIIVMSRISIYYSIFLMLTLVTTILGVLVFHYHYLTDIVAGLIWAVVTVGLSKLVMRNYKVPELDIV